MIIGHGIDLQDISAIQQAYEKNPKFAQRILTEAEFRRFSEHTNLKRQMAFLAGRWAGKEAFAKAMGTGIGKLRFQDIEILNNSQGALLFREGLLFPSLTREIMPRPVLS